MCHNPWNPSTNFLFSLSRKEALGKNEGKEEIEVLVYVINLLFCGLLCAVIMDEVTLVKYKKISILWSLVCSNQIDKVTFVKYEKTYSRCAIISFMRVPVIFRLMHSSKGCP